MPQFSVGNWALNGVRGERYWTHFLLRASRSVSQLVWCRWCSGRASTAPLLGSWTTTSSSSTAISPNPGVTWGEGSTGGAQTSFIMTGLHVFTAVSVFLQTYPQSPVPVLCCTPHLRAHDVSKTADGRTEDKKKVRWTLPVWLSGALSSFFEPHLKSVLILICST